MRTSPFQPKGCILFDWGDTLMRVFQEYSGPMKDWPRVEAVPGAAAALAVLHDDWLLAVATNAADSDEADIRSALRRLDLERWLDRVYCYKKIGFKKPSPEFFRFILDDLRLSPNRAVMVGDDFENDVLGAIRCGMQAVWLHPGEAEPSQGQGWQRIRCMDELPGSL